MLSKSVLVIWTSNSVKSSHVIDEASRASVLIPVKLDDVDIPLGFGSIHTQDLVEWDSTNTSKEYLQPLDALSNSSEHQGSELNSTTTVTEEIPPELKGPWHNGPNWVEDGPEVHYHCQKCSHVEIYDDIYDWNMRGRQPVEREYRSCGFDGIAADEIT